jgi:hypothetical protein
MKALTTRRVAPTETFVADENRNHFHFGLRYPYENMCVADDSANAADTADFDTKGRQSRQ